MVCKIEVEIIFIPSDCGGRKYMPTGSGYCPYLHKDDMEYAVRINGIPENSNFDDAINVEVEFLYEDKVSFHNKEYLMFYEGSKLIAEGTFLKHL